MDSWKEGRERLNCLFRKHNYSDIHPVDSDTDVMMKFMMAMMDELEPMIEKANNPLLVFENGEKVVSMVEFRGELYVASEHGVYKRTEDDQLVRLEIIEVDKQD